MGESNVFNDACDDIKENFWAISPEAKSRIIKWFQQISFDSYERGRGTPKDQETVSQTSSLSEAVDIFSEALAESGNYGVMWLDKNSDTYALMSFETAVAARTEYSKRRAKGQIVLNIGWSLT